MKLVDTHTHLYVDRFQEDIKEVLERSQENQVEAFFLPNIDQDSISDMLALEAAYPDRCFAMMGLHPCSVKENYKEELAIVKDWLFKRSFCAVGEIGIDLYWDKTFVKQQEEAFLQQIEWAKELDLPIVIHSRESTDIIIKLLQTVKEERLRGIFHCFGGTVAQAEQIIGLGFHLGIGGVLTFKKSGLDKTMEAVDLNWVVLETDSPYLAPVPYRGKRNESAYIRLIAEKLALVKGVSLAEVAEITTRNAAKIFGRDL